MRLVAVMVGGAVGAVARWAVGGLLGASPDGFPTATLVANLSGAFALGVLGVLLAERLPPTRHLRLLVGTGVLGAFTTFSTMAVEGVQLLTSGRVGVALGYWLVTLIGGQMAGVYGMWLGRLNVRGGTPDGTARRGTAAADLHRRKRPLPAQAAVPRDRPGGPP